MNNINYISIFNEKDELVSSTENNYYKETIKKILYSLRKDINKAIIIRKNDVYICLRNILVDNKYIFIISADNDAYNQKFMTSLVNNIFNLFINSYLDNFKSKKNDEEFFKNIKKSLFIDQIKKTKNEFDNSSSKFKEIEKNLEESTEITKINLNKFIEREENLNDIKMNTELLENTAMRFQIESKNLKRFHLIQKYRIYILYYLPLFVDFYVYLNFNLLYY